MMGLPGRKAGYKLLECRAANKTLGIPSYQTIQLTGDPKLIINPGKMTKMTMKREQLVDNCYDSGLIRKLKTSPIHSISGTFTSAPIFPCFKRFRG
jgi:hypothetical protein